MRDGGRATYLKINTKPPLFVSDSRGEGKGGTVNPSHGGAKCSRTSALELAQVIGVYSGTRRVVSKKLLQDIEQS